EYQREGFLLFQQMLGELRQSVVRKLFYYEIPSAEDLMKHIEEEERRRREMEQRMQLVHEGSATSGADEVTQDEDSKSPDDQRAKMLAQKRARRKSKK
ncbi:MAG: hypothetical protein KDD60_05150, partial [Bdellovibrionales bacterium]|nr:hypothetical protein [Bdellovibrionales bacterium]